MDLYHKYISTGDTDYRTKICLSYLTFISALIQNMDFGIENGKEDIISELLVIVNDAIDNYDNKKASIYTYLYRIIYTKSIDKLRKAGTIKKYKSDIDLDYLLKFEEESEHKISHEYNRVTDGNYNIMDYDNSQQIQKALKSLTPKEAQLIKLRHLEQQTITHIMQTMKISRKSFGELELSGLAKLKNNDIIKEMRSV